jgi:hypothetical protein
MCKYREAPPPYPYPRVSFIPMSFFDIDWRYLDKPEKLAYDWSYPLKRIRCFDDNVLFTTGGEFRYRHMNEVDSRLTGINNSYDLLRTRVYGDIAIRDRVRIYAEYIDAQTYDQKLVPLIIDQNHSDLLNLFVDINLFSYNDTPLYFRYGRQELLYGSQRLVSPLDWANTRRTFQGGKLFWHSDKLDVDAFIVQPVIPDPGHFDSVDNQQIFTGLFGTYRPEQGQTIDLYYFNLDRNLPVAAGRGGLLKGTNDNTIGGRYAGDSYNWLWDVEGALQFGSWSNQDIFAGMATVAGGYYFKDVPLTPQVWLSYDYASGDPHPGVGGTHRTFDQLFPFGHYYFGFIDVVGRKNIHDLNYQLSCYPTPWITALMQHHFFWLDERKDALYNAAGVPIRIDPTGKAGNYVGNELDFVTNFHLTNHQDILFGYSHLYIGDFIRNTARGAASFKSPDYFYVQYSFKW